MFFTISRVSKKACNRVLGWLWGPGMPGALGLSFFLFLVAAVADKDTVDSFRAS